MDILAINMSDVLKDITDFVQNHLIVIIVIASILVIFIYVMYAVFLNKLNHAMYGRTTWMAWIPIFNTYLLGKLTIGKIFGFLLVIGSLLGSSFVIKINGVTDNYSLLPTEFQEPYSIIYFAILVILYIYAHIKLKNIIRKKGLTSDVDMHSASNYSNLNRPFISKNTPVNSVKDNYSNGIYDVESNVNIKKDDINNKIENGINEEGISSKIRLSDISKKNTDQIDEYNDMLNSKNNQNP